MSESNARFAKDDKRVILVIRIGIVLVAFASATLADVSLMDTISDTFMAAMAAVNMIVVCLLSRQVFEAYADYRKQKKEGTYTYDEDERRRNGAGGSTVYAYYYCPSCKQQVRIPAGKGRVNVTCPRCGEKFSANS